MAGKVQLTMLNSMAARDIASAMDRHVALRLRRLDLKDSIFGKGVVDLTDDEARQVRQLADDRGLRVYCMSTVLFYGRVEDGEAPFRRAHLDPVDRAIAVARILQPRFIRLLASKTERRAEIANITQYILREHPWLIAAYQEAADRITSAGFNVAIENEVHGCIWSKPEEITHFFDALARPAVRFIWDIQNLWQMGTFPSLEVYRQLQPLIGMVHVKGGQAQQPGGLLKWSTALADASWPVADILKAVIADGVSPVICLNSSHGEGKAGYDYANVVVRDIEFLRRSIREIE